MLALPDSPAKQAWLREHLDLSEIANFTALTVAMRHWDSGSKNFYIVANPRHRALAGPQLGPRRHLQRRARTPRATSSSRRRRRARCGGRCSTWPTSGPCTTARSGRWPTSSSWATAWSTGSTQLTTAYAGDLALDKQAWGGWTLTTGRNRIVQGVQERRTRSRRTPTPPRSRRHRAAPPGRHQRAAVQPRHPGRRRVLRGLQPLCHRRGHERVDRVGDRLHVPARHGRAGTRVCRLRRQRRGLLARLRR